MALKTKVKVGNVTSLSEARFCAGMGVDFLGFSFYNNFETDYKRFRNIASWVSGPKFVAECIDEETIKRVVNEKVEAEYIQVDLRYLNPEQLAAYKLFIIVPDCPPAELIDTLLSLSDKDHCVLVSLIGFENLKNQLGGFTIFMEEGEGENQLSLDKILALPADGIFVEGHDEIKPGIQDYDRLATLLEKLEINED